MPQHPNEQQLRSYSSQRLLGELQRRGHKIAIHQPAVVSIMCETCNGTGVVNDYEALLDEKPWKPCRDCGRSGWREVPRQAVHQAAGV